jgi:hypothetical protein
VLEEFSAVSDALAHAPKLKVADAAFNFERLQASTSAQLADDQQLRISWVLPAVPSERNQGRILASMRVEVASSSVWRQLFGQDAPAAVEPVEVTAGREAKDAFRRTALPVPARFLGNDQWVPQPEDAGITKYFTVKQFNNSSDISFWLEKQNVLVSGKNFRPGDWSFVYDPRTKYYFHLQRPVALSLF